MPELAQLPSSGGIGGKITLENSRILENPGGAEQHISSESQERSSVYFRDRHLRPERPEPASRMARMSEWLEFRLWIPSHRQHDSGDYPVAAHISMLRRAIISCVRAHSRVRAVSGRSMVGNQGKLGVFKVLTGNQKCDKLTGNTVGIDLTIFQQAAGEP